MIFIVYIVYNCIYIYTVYTGICGDREISVVRVDLPPFPSQFFLVVIPESAIAHIAKSRLWFMMMNG